MSVSLSVSWAGKGCKNRFTETAHIVFYFINFKWLYLSIGLGQTTASFTQVCPMVYICSHEEALLCFGKRPRQTLFT